MTTKTWSKSRTKYLVCDFETTVYEGQKSTEVWAAASVEMFTEDVKIFHNIKDQFEHFFTHTGRVVCYYHNLKFDGSFWLPFLMFVLKLKQAYRVIDEEKCIYQFMEDKEMPEKSFKYSISDRGQWYSITIKYNGRIIEIRDSYKLLPFSVKKIGDSFETKHKKLDIKYEGYRYAGCEITEREQEYIANDVLVVKEGLEQLFKDGHTKLTIGACCMAEYKKTVQYLTGNGKLQWKKWFPDLTKIDIPDFLGLKDSKGNKLDSDAYCRAAYRGGWCYVVQSKAKKRWKNGFTADVNSLYPSVMHSESGNFYPVGEPTYWKGNYIPREALRNDYLPHKPRFYILRVRTKFKLRQGYLPFIQAKGNPLYPPNESLSTSDIWFAGKYHKKYMTADGEKEAELVLTVTTPEWELIQKHYELYDTEILDGCYFETEIGIFDEYIDKYRKIKETSEGAVREEAKLFLNNLYGKFGTSRNSSFKVAYMKDDGVVGFITVEDNTKEVGFVPVAAAVTAYARSFTITAAQANYYGGNKRGFVYADTDSIHCNLSINEVKGINIHPTNFCCWKVESEWDEAYFTRQKTYIEHIVKEDGVPVEQKKDKDGNYKKPYYLVKCAGMPDKCKKLFVRSMLGEKLTDEEINENEYTQEEIDFIKEKRKLSDFDVGLTVPGKLMPKRIVGGIILTTTTYKMR